MHGLPAVRDHALPGVCCVCKAFCNLPLKYFNNICCWLVWHERRQPLPFSFWFQWALLQLHVHSRDWQQLQPVCCRCCHFDQVCELSAIGYNCLYALAVAVWCLTLRWSHVLGRYSSVESELSVSYRMLARDSGYGTIVQAVWHRPAVTPHPGDACLHGTLQRLGVVT